MLKRAASERDTGAWYQFEQEVLPHVDRLFRLAMWFVRNRADAEDVVQDTMMQALKSFHRFQPGTNCRAWLTTILQRIVSNRRRAAGRSIVVDDPDDRIAQSVPFVQPCRRSSLTNASLKHCVDCRRRSRRSSCSATWRTSPT